MMRRAAVTLLGLLCMVSLHGQAQDPESRVRAELAAARALPQALAARVDRVIEPLWQGFSETEAMATVELASRYWRLPGNTGYDATLDRVALRVGSTTFEVADEPSAGWDHSVATLALVRTGEPDQVVLSRERERLALAINSYSTNGPIDAPLVDVGRGQAGDFDGKNVTGAVVIGDAELAGLFRQAVVMRGALGVISTSLASYIAADPDILQWGSIPRDPDRKAFGFKASRRATQTLRAALGTGPQRVKVEIASTFAEKPERTLVHEIRGQSRPDERIVIAAHVQEPGANDNASGVATLQELAVALTHAIATGQIPPPTRTITFVWLNEISGSRAWLQRHAAVVPGVKYMFSMDMTGEDVTTTGASFLVERWPDPGAIWTRAWDPHSAWGAGNVRKDSLKGDLINDLHLAVCERVARRTGWIVKTNPYEGGSDHTVFGSAGIPSLLNWHFTDPYYHSNMDTPDKTSAAEMRNVGVAVATSAWLMASADESASLDVADLVTRAGRARVAIELREGAALPDHADALAAWRTWSAGAVRSVSRLIVGAPSEALANRIEQLATSLLPDVQTCGGDRERAVADALSKESILLAADRRLFSPCRDGDHGPTHLEVRDLALLDQAAESLDPEFRRLAVQAFGRLGAATMAPRIIRRLTDAQATVRSEAANALGQALSGTRSDLRDDPPPTPAEVTAGRVALERQLEREQVDDVASVLLATIGRLRHAASELDAVESLLIARTTGSPVRLLGAATALESLARLNPRRPLTEPARVRLRALAALGRSSDPAVVQVRRMAMTALQVARDTETGTMVEAATDPDWQVRRVAVQMMNPAIDRVRPAVIATLRDPSAHVRIEAVRSFARGLSTIRDCRPLVMAMADANTLVALQAIDSVSADCPDRVAVVAALIPMADLLSDATRATTWHRPARALSALSRLAPDEARRRIPVAKKHAAWQVRATAATAAGTLNDDASVIELSNDRAPNVRTAALDALVRMKHADTAAVAMRALAADDHQLIRAGAQALAGSTDAGAIPALLASLRRLTALASDTSRDPRVAIIERLTELLGHARVEDLVAWTGDWDTAVRASALRAFETAHVPVPPRPRQFRYPSQPTAKELRDVLAAREADIVLADGSTITLRFLTSDAPMTVARFVSRARSGAYDGLTFHRVVPNFVVQGLSPGANEYVGDDRFMRDEVGLVPHRRGAVGISTRGYDTGDAQIFFDLVDVPRLNHDYTVFATVTSGLEHVDTLLEGAEVRRVVIR